MKEFFTEHGTKLYGGITAFLGTLASLIAAGAFKELLSVNTIGWLNIFVALATAVVGGMTMARGFNNSTAQNVAKAMESAINATPGKQAGFIRAAVLGMLLAIGVVAVGSMSGCTHTQTAIKNADTPSDYALIFLEGYDAALKTANQLKATGALSGDTLAKVQAAELKAWPLVKQIDPLRVAYEQTRSAQDAAALQLAIDNAIRAAAEFVQLVKSLR